MTEIGKPQPDTSDIVKAAEAVDQRLRDDTTFSDRIISIIDKRLGSGPTTESLGQVFQGITEYAGIDIANFTLQALVPEDMEQAFEAADRQGIPEAVIDWLHLLRAMYSESLLKANLMYRNNPDDWMFFTREVLRDEVREAWVVRLIITKYKGDELVLVGGSNMPLNLAREILSLLVTFPSSDNFGAEELRLMLAQLEAFQAKFGKATPGSPPDETLVAKVAVPSVDPALAQPAGA